MADEHIKRDALLKWFEPYLNSGETWVEIHSVLDAIYALSDARNDMITLELTVEELLLVRSALVLRACELSLKGKCDEAEKYEELREKIREATKGV